jgi:hypothetical protein
MMRLDPIECWPVWKLIEAKRLHALRRAMVSLSDRSNYILRDPEFIEFAAYLAEHQ